MKLVIQRVDEAKVTVDEAIIGRISKGLLILVGVSDTDTTDIADKMLDKALKMRIFDDESGKTNLSLSDVGGELLLVSQFTLYANCKRAIALPSWMPVNRSTQKLSMNTCLPKQTITVMSYNMDLLVHICMYRWLATVLSPLY